MATKVYKWNSDTEQYELDAEWHEDGTVSGDGDVASRLNHAVDVIEEDGGDPADYYENIKKRLQTNWDNGLYRVGWE